MKGTNEMKHIVYLFLVAVLIALVLITVCNVVDIDAKELDSNPDDITYKYDVAINWLDDQLPADFLTTIKWYDYGSGNDYAVLFEDGSWIVMNWTGCLQGWDCDSDGEFNFDIVSCETTAVGWNEYLRDPSLQVEQDCTNTAGYELVTLSLSGESEPLGQMEVLIRNHAPLKLDRVLHFPLMVLGE